jgi:pimeloyl-ACP methyl ester carboxylesterase
MFNMRPFEIVFIVINLTVIGFYFFPEEQRPRQLRFLATLGIAALLAHLLVEKPRWQLVPAYILTLYLLLKTWQEYLHDQQPHRFHWPIMLSGSWLLFCALPVLVPVPVLPTPDGPYAVGSTTFYWTDNNRIETLAPEQTNAPRRIKVQVWYPIDHDSDLPTEPYLEEMLTGIPDIAKRFGIPKVLLYNVNLVKTNSHAEATLTTDIAQFPVIIFSHGWTGTRVQNTSLMEALVSEGYILFAPDHTYGAVMTSFPDGQLVLSNTNLLPENVHDTDLESAREVGLAWSGDLRFVMDQMEALNEGDILSQFSGRLDLTRLGVMGHSTGGGATVETCWLDERCTAGLAMDAWMDPYDLEIAETGVQQPFLFMQSEGWSQENTRSNRTFAQFTGQLRPDQPVLTIAGTAHLDFSDVPLGSPLAHAAGYKGPINGNRVIKIVHDYTLVFFNHYLKGEPLSPLLLGPSESYPEITFNP